METEVVVSGSKGEMTKKTSWIRSMSKKHRRKSFCWSAKKLYYCRDRFRVFRWTTCETFIADTSLPDFYGHRILVLWVFEEIVWDLRSNLLSNVGGCNHVQRAWDSL